MDAMGTAKKHGRRYPWRLWYSKRRVLLIRGIDFDCRPDVFAQMAYQAMQRAEKKGHPIPMRVSVLPCETRILLESDKKGRL